MERAAAATVVDFTQEIDRALREVDTADADVATETAGRLSDRLTALEGWAEEVRSAGSVEPDAVPALRQLQQRAYRLARVIRHVQWVRRGLIDIAGVTVSGYERDGQYRRTEGIGIVLKG